MKPFAEMNYEEAVAQIDARKEATVGRDGYTANRAIVEDHDFWREGNSWVGPRGTAAAWAAALRDSVEKQHVPGAATIEALGNFGRGLFGKEPNIQAVSAGPIPEAAEEKSQEKADELIGMLSAWWDDAGLWRAMRLAGMRSRWATWGDVRLRVLDGKLEEDAKGAVRLPTFSTMEEALAAIALSAPEPEHCIVLTHPSTGERGAIFHFIEKDEAGQEKKSVELWYQDGEQTMLRILHEKEDPEGPLSFDWGGELPVAEMEGELMITEPVRRQEGALSFAETNIVKIGETAGFRERYTMNAEPNGIWQSTVPTDVPAPRTSTDGAGRKLYLHPMPRALGPAITTDLVGKKGKASDGSETRVMPGVHIADPVDPEYGIKGAEYRRARVLQLCGQGHLAMTSGAEASGFAYEQSRAVFRGDLEWHKSPAEMAILNILTAVIRMAESMTSEPANWLERFRLVVTLTVDPGPVSPAMIDMTLKQVDATVLSRGAAMARLGVEDVAAELAAIDADPLSLVTLRTKQVAIIQTLHGEGMLWALAAQIAGIEDEELLKHFRDADTQAATTRTQEGAEGDEILRALREPITA